MDVSDKKADNSASIICNFNYHWPVSILMDKTYAKLHVFFWSIFLGLYRPIDLLM